MQLLTCQNPYLLHALQYWQQHFRLPLPLCQGHDHMTSLSYQLQAVLRQPHDRPLLTLMSPPLLLPGLSLPPCWFRSRPWCCLLPWLVTGLVIMGSMTCKLLTGHGRLQALLTLP